MLKNIKSNNMIYIFFATLFYLLFNLYENYRLNKILSHDKQMFKMARFRSELIDELILKYRSISKNDAVDLLRLIRFTSISISNHKTFYSKLFHFILFIQELNLTRNEVTNVEPLINKIHNKKIKGYYEEFGKILISGITQLRIFKILSFIIYLFSWLSFSPLRKIISNVNWYTNKQSELKLA